MRTWQTRDEATRRDSAARAAAAADPSPANRAKLARLVAALKAYHDLPTEHDAFGTENALATTWEESTVPAPAAARTGRR